MESSRQDDQIQCDQAEAATKEDEATVDESAYECIQDRLMLKNIIVLLGCMQDSESQLFSERVAFSRDMAAIAMFERIGRIMKNDLLSSRSQP